MNAKKKKTKSNRLKNIKEGYLKFLYTILFSLLSFKVKYPFANNINQL